MTGMAASQRRLRPCRLLAHVLLPAPGGIQALGLGAQLAVAGNHVCGEAQR